MNLLSQEHPATPMLPVMNLCSECILQSPITHLHLQYPIERIPIMSTQQKVLPPTWIMSNLLRLEHRLPSAFGIGYPCYPRPTDQEPLIYPILILWGKAEGFLVGVSISSKQPFLRIWTNNETGGVPQQHPHPFAALPLHEVLSHLTPCELSFFAMLDAQLDKVESFYLAREKEMLDRSRTLQIQLSELNDHRKLFYVRPYFLPHSNRFSDVVIRRHIPKCPGSLLFSMKPQKNLDCTVRGRDTHRYCLHPQTKT